VPKHRGIRVSILEIVISMTQEKVELVGYPRSGGGEAEYGSSERRNLKGEIPESVAKTQGRKRDGRRVDVAFPQEDSKEGADGGRLGGGEERISWPTR